LFKLTIGSHHSRPMCDLYNKIGICSGRSIIFVQNNKPINKLRTGWCAIFRTPGLSDTLSLLYAAPSGAGEVGGQLFYNKDHAPSGAFSMGNWVFLIYLVFQ